MVQIFPDTKKNTSDEQILNKIKKVCWRMKKMNGRSRCLKSRGSYLLGYHGEKPASPIPKLTQQVCK